MLAFDACDWLIPKPDHRKDRIMVGDYASEIEKLRG